MKYRFLRFPEGKLKAVTFSYDDGVRQDIRFARTLEKYGMKATFNVNSGMFGLPGKNGGRLSAEEIKENIIDMGHEVAIHGEQHIASAACRPIDCIKDALNCRLALEREFGMIIRGMAYPDSGITKCDNGNSYATVKQCLTDLDIVYSRTLGGDNNSFRLPDDWHAWMPTAHHNNPKIFEYIDEFNAIDGEKLYSSHRFPRLFYIWGHTYEFDRNDNWEHLDKICEAISGKSDVWYATNIEIYDYVEAYRSLVFSADGKRVYNPTLKTVWFNLDGKDYSISSGETLICE